MVTKTHIPETTLSWQSPFAQFLGAGTSAGSSDSVPAIQEAPHQFGTPDTDQQHWQGQQGYDDTCAIRCQEYILEQFSGRQFSEEALMRQAMDHGWYEPGTGTPGQDVGNLLELNGIPVTRVQNATVFNLSNELAQGHKVIVGVDAGELWHRNALLDGLADKLGLSGANHAIVVSGIDTSDPDHIKVIVSDPGTGDAAATYPLDQFVDAWQDSGCYMVATQNPAPPHVPGMANFDYAQGHIGRVWGLDYNSFLGLADQPELWSSYLDRSLNATSTTDKAEDGFGAATSDRQPTTEPHSFLADIAPFSTPLAGLVDHFLKACHFNDESGHPQPDNTHQLATHAPDVEDLKSFTDFDNDNV